MSNEEYAPGPNKEHKFEISVVADVLSKKLFGNSEEYSSWANFSISHQTFSKRNNDKYGKPRMYKQNVYNVSCYDFLGKESDGQVVEEPNMLATKVRKFYETVEDPTKYMVRITGTQYKNWRKDPDVEGKYLEDTTIRPRKLEFFLSESAKNNDEAEQIAEAAFGGVQPQKLQPAYSGDIF